MGRRARFLLVGLAAIALLLYGGNRLRRRARQAAERAKLRDRDALLPLVRDPASALAVLAVDHELVRSPDEDLPALHRFAPPPLRRLRDLPTGKKRLEILESGDLIVRGDTARGYDLTTGEALPAPPAEDAPQATSLPCIAEEKNGEVVVSAVRGSHETALGRVHGHTAPVLGCALAGWRPLGAWYAATSAADNTVRVWELKVSEPIVTIDVGYSPAVMWLAPDATRLVVADELAEDVRIYDITLDAAVKQLCAAAKDAPIAARVCP